MRFIRAVAALLCAAGMTGCGAGGLLNLNPQPDGNIVITNATTGETLQTTQANPLVVTGGGFSIGIAENHFNGPYKLTVTNWTAGFSVPCFVPHYVDQTNKTNVVKFSADNAAPVASPTQPNPCVAGDEETATIIDGHGHTVLFFYQIPS
jgi:hypothetical protein